MVGANRRGRGILSGAARARRDSDPIGSAAVLWTEVAVGFAIVAYVGARTLAFPIRERI